MEKKGKRLFFLLKWEGLKIKIPSRWRDLFTRLCFELFVGRTPLVFQDWMFSKTGFGLKTGLFHRNRMFGFSCDRTLDFVGFL